MKATPYFHRMPKTSQRASDVTEGSRKWYAIEQELQEFDKYGRTGLTVDLLYRFEKQANSNPPISTIPSSSAASGSIRSSSHVVASNPTQALQQVREKSNLYKLNQIIDDIFKTWRYTDRRCINFQKYCYPKSNEHYILTSKEART